MKKKLFMIIIAMFSLSLLACSSSQTNTISNEDIISNTDDTTQSLEQTTIIESTSKEADISQNETTLNETSAITEIPSTNTNETTQEVPTHVITQQQTNTPTTTPVATTTVATQITESETNAPNAHFFSYEMRGDGSIFITGYTGNEKNLVIPEKINGFIVTGIADDFNGVFALKEIETVQFPNSIKYIGACAFRSCKKLTSINIPNSVTTIEGGAFLFCSSLKDVYIPSSVTYIGDDAFELSFPSLIPDSEEESSTSEPTNNCIFTVDNNSYAKEYLTKHNYKIVIK